MTKTYLRNCFALILSIFVFSCSSDSAEDDQNSNDDFQLTTDLNEFSYGIDEKITMTISSEEILESVCVEIDNYSEELGTWRRCDHTGNLGKTITANLTLPSVGSRTLTVSGIDQNQGTSKVSYDIEIDLTNTVRIKTIVLNSFNGRGETHDPEFSDTDDNRLADPFFVMKKRVTGLRVNEDGLDDIDWLVSEVLENEGDLTWNLENENLVIGANTEFKFFLYDDDGPMVTPPQNLLIGSANFVQFSFSDFSATRPNEVIFVHEESGLEVLFGVEWN